MAKPGDVIDVPDLGAAVRVPRHRGVHGRRVHGGRRGRPPARLHHAPARPRRRDRAPRGDRGRRCGSSCTARSTRCAPATDRDPARRAALPAPRRRGTGRVRVRLTPAGASTQFFERLGADRSTTASASRSPLDGARFVADLGASGHAARPSLKTQQRLARGCSSSRPRVRVRRRVARRRAARGRLRRARRRQHLPGVVEAGLHRRRDDGEYTLQHFKGRLPVPPAHAHADGRGPSARTSCRARPTATCAAPASGRSAENATAAPTCASTGACTPTASCSAPHAVPAPRAALEPQLGDRPRDGRAGALRAAKCKVAV